MFLLGPILSTDLEDESRRRSAFDHDDGGWRRLATAACSGARSGDAAVLQSQSHVTTSATNRLIGEVVQSRKRPVYTYRGVNARLSLSLNSVLNVKAVVGAFNQEKALVGAFSV